MDHKQVVELASKFNVPGNFQVITYISKCIHFCVVAQVWEGHFAHFEQFYEVISHIPHCEGFVIKTADNSMYKVKTKWFLEHTSREKRYFLHHKELHLTSDNKTIKDKTIQEDGDDIFCERTENDNGR